MDSLEATVEALTRRIRKLEDEQEIQRVIVMYGLALDVGDPERTAALYTENAFYDVDGTDVMQGRSAISAMVLVGDPIAATSCGARHRPAAVEVRGDRARRRQDSPAPISATGDTIHLHRVVFNHWDWNAMMNAGKLPVASCDWSAIQMRRMCCAMVSSGSMP